MSNSRSLSAVERQKLQQWIAAHGTPQQVATRCRIVLAADAGESNVAIAGRLSVNRNTVILWRQRFADEGLDGLSAEEAREIEYRDYQSFEIPFIHPGTVRERRASWSSILATITQPGLGQRVRASLQAIETANPDKFSRLFGSMIWTSEEVLSGEVLAAVMQAMDRRRPCRTPRASPA